MERYVTENKQRPKPIEYEDKIALRQEDTKKKKKKGKKKTAPKE